MCYFITAILPNYADTNLLAPIFKNHRLSFQKITNSNLTSELAIGDLQILTASGYCDCDTVLGILNRPSGKSLNAELNRLKNKGWSKTKIQRWLEQKEQKKEKQSKSLQASQWINFITDVLKLGGIKRIGLLLHWYMKAVENEPIKLHSKNKIKLTNLTPSLLMKMNEDELYEFLL